MWVIMYGANTGRNKDLLLSYHEHVIFEIHETMAEKVEVESAQCTTKELKKSHRTSAAKFWRAMLTQKWSSLENSTS
jgi:hypothetical protein